MFTARLMTGAIPLAVALLSIIPNSSSARDTYFSPNCGSCHPVEAYTCNGCHVHGTHSNYDANSVRTLNLQATTDKSAYTEGESIVITLDGGNMPDFKGWVGVRVYDDQGVEATRKQSQLGCNPGPTTFGIRCDLPMKLNVPARMGWTRLYVAWAGNRYDRSGAAYGTVLTTFGAGQRPLRDATGNQVTGHIEEIVATGAFTVAAAPPGTTPPPAPTPTPAPAPAPDTGGNPDATTMPTPDAEPVMDAGSTSPDDSGAASGSTGAAPGTPAASANAGSVDMLLGMALYGLLRLRRRP